MHYMHVGIPQGVNYVSHQKGEKKKHKVGGLILVQNMTICYIKYQRSMNDPT